MKKDINKNRWFKCYVSRNPRPVLAPHRTVSEGWADRARSTEGGKLVHHLHSNGGSRTHSKASHGDTGIILFLFLVKKLFDKVFFPLAQ